LKKNSSKKEASWDETAVEERRGWGKEVRRIVGTQKMFEGKGPSTEENQHLERGIGKRSPERGSARLKNRREEKARNTWGEEEGFREENQRKTEGIFH